MKPRFKLSGVSALLGVLLVAGCAAPQVQDTPENIVRQRAKARWDALIGRDFQKAYQFLQPSYRALRDFEAYRGTVDGGMVQRTGADVVGVECKPDLCVAKIRIDFKVPMKGFRDPLATHVDERWIMEQGNWWLYQAP